MLDHVGLAVSDYDSSVAFYERALAPLGYVPLVTTHGWTGFGCDGRAQFWIGPGAAAPTFHLAFAAESRDEVDAFYDAAIAAGGRDNGRPGLRPHYHRHYYAAFVIDPNGYNIEAACHARHEAK